MALLLISFPSLWRITQIWPGEMIQWLGAPDALEDPDLLLIAYTATHNDTCAASGLESGIFL